MITTERLEIRPMRRQDWRALQEIVLDFQKSEYRIYDRRIRTDDPGIQTVAVYAELCGTWFAVRMKGEARMLGYICLHFEKNVFDVGYCFHSDAHGKGIAFESISALLKYIGDLTGVSTFTAGTALDNHPSVRLLQRLGFVMIGTETLAFWQDADGNDLAFTGGKYLLELPKID